jgi:3-isopropylmalate dehydrogenase
MERRTYSIAVLGGDGIGPECIESTVEVLLATAGIHGLSFDLVDYEMGAALFARTGYAISPGDLEAVGSADAVLLGAMGLPNVRQANGLEIAPQIDLRERYGLFASLRPIRRFDGVPPTIIATDIDMLVIRETTEGLFAGRHDDVEVNDKEMSDRLTITRTTSEKLFHLAFHQARLRKASGGQGKVTIFDKSNVLKSFVFMRRVFDEIAAEYPDIETERIYIDAGCMMMVLNPGRFDVIVTENQFGDIVSELAAGLVGGLGVAPSADVSEERGVFQPSHGTAPDIAGTGVANPIATILSAAMMLDWLSEKNGDIAASEAADDIRRAVAEVLATGPRTRDLGGTGSTTDVTARVLAALSTNALNSSVLIP